MTKAPKRPRDPNQLAKMVVDLATADASQPALAPPEDQNKDPNAIALGRRGGLKGGRARAVALTHEERVAIARGAAAKRWGK
jgi:hypothetical protein